MSRYAPYQIQGFAIDHDNTKHPIQLLSIDTVNDTDIYLNYTLPRVCPDKGTRKLLPKNIEDILKCVSDPARAKNLKNRLHEGNSKYNELVHRMSLDETAAAFLLSDKHYPHKNWQSAVTVSLIFDKKSLQPIDANICLTQAQMKYQTDYHQARRTVDFYMAQANNDTKRAQCIAESGEVGDERQHHELQQWRSIILANCPNSEDLGFQGLTERTISLVQKAVRDFTFKENGCGILQARRRDLVTFENAPSNVSQWISAAHLVNTDPKGEHNLYTMPISSQKNDAAALNLAFLCYHMTHGEPYIDPSHVEALALLCNYNNKLKKQQP